jgi:adenine-specific DNA-methyltransferase
MLGYIGSKKSLISFLDSHISNVITNETVFADLFAGTGVVSQYFKNKVMTVVANDAEFYSYVINYAMLKSDFSDKLALLIEELNNLTGIEGIITKHYATDRQFFTVDNAKRMDAIRTKIEELKNTEAINEKEYYYLIASFLIASDKVANTASVYGAYLKKYKSSALKSLLMKPIHTITNNSDKNHNACNQDTLNLIQDFVFDVVYIDPPYNHRQYSANYGLLNYLAYYDSNIEIVGKSGLIKNYFKSSFCKKAEVLASFEKLIQQLKAKVIFVSYNNEGLLSKDELTQVFEKYGTVTCYVEEYKKFLSHKESKHKEIKVVQEYLFQIDK